MKIAHELSTYHDNNLFDLPIANVFRKTVESSALEALAWRVLVYRSR